MLGSTEIHDIAVALGIDPDNEDLSQLRYGKVCILADADSDGLHIATLLCALFLRHFPKLVQDWARLCSNATTLSYRLRQRSVFMPSMKAKKKRF